jgi:hypothetical protein
MVWSFTGLLLQFWNLFLINHALASMVECSDIIRFDTSFCMHTFNLLCYTRHLFLHVKYNMNCEKPLSLKLLQSWDASHTKPSMIIASKMRFKANANLFLMSGPHILTSNVGHQQSILISRWQEYYRICARQPVRRTKLCWQTHRTWGAKRVWPK